MQRTKHKLGRDACLLLNPDHKSLSAGRLTNTPGGGRASGRNSPAAEAALAEPLPRVNFSAWQEWRGKEVARFLNGFCGMPQYAKAAEQNLTGISLVELCMQGIINKGLSRAGIVDFDHLRQIAADVKKLQTNSPEELQRELELRWEGRQQRRAEELNATARLMARNPVKLAPLASKRVQTFHPDRAEEVVSPHWRFRRTHVEMQKSASEGALIDPFFSKVRFTPAPNVRPAMGQVIATGKGNYDSGLKIAIDEARLANELQEFDIREREAAQQRREAQEQADREAAREALEEARRQDAENKRLAEAKREQERSAAALREEIKKAAKAEEEAEADAETIRLAAENAAIEAKKRQDDALKAGLDPIDLCLKEMFEINDLDHSGFVDMEESITTQRRMCRFIGVPFDEEEAKQSFLALDANADGDISFEEFAKYSRARFGDMDQTEVLTILLQVTDILREANKEPRSPKTPKTPKT